MGRHCSVCANPAREAIDRALVAGEAPFALARRYSSLSEPALRRHKAEHLPAALVKAAGEEEVRQALDVLQQLKAINAVAMRTMVDAHNSGDGELALKAVDRVLRQIELQAKLLGELDESPRVVLVAAPEWVALRSALLAALRPFPEALAAVVGAIRAQSA
jgi:hypothetical protein